MTKVARRKPLAAPPAEPTTPAPPVEDAKPASTVKTSELNKIVRAFTAFRKQKNAEAAAKAAHEELRDRQLMPALVEYGRAHGEKGQHLAIDLPDEIDGFTRLVRRANTSTYVDVTAAEKLLKKKGVLEDAQVVSVMITGIPATRSEELLEAIEKLKLEKKFGVLPQVETSFSQEALYALHQRHRAEIQQLEEEAGKPLGVRAKSKYLLETDIDGLLVSETNYSFHPERSS